MKRKKPNRNKSVRHTDYVQGIVLTKGLKSHTHCGTREAVDGTPPLGFYCVSIFPEDFAFNRKPSICPTIYYIMGWGAAGGQ